MRDNPGDLLAFVRRRAGHIVDPEDVLQQTAVRALFAIDQLREPASGRAWLFRIVRNVLDDELRALGLYPSPSPSMATFQPSRSNSADTYRYALDLARTLEAEYHDIWKGSFSTTFRSRRSPAALGVTPNYATVRLHRARRALRSVLLEHCGSTSMRACLSCGCEERGCCAV